MATITEDYVSFEIAKLLKKKGFDEPCMYFHKDPQSWLYEFRNRKPKAYSDEPVEPCFLAPTLQMACKWLVREHRLYVNVVPSVEGHYWTEKWHSYVEDLNERYPFGEFISTFNSPEEACEAAIKYCLENLI